MQTSTKDSVLKILNDEKFHSGEEIALQLGVSRAAVGKHVASLKALGLDIVGVTGKGYKLGESVDLLDAETILMGSDLAEKIPLPIVVPVIASTNHFLMQQIGENLLPGQSCFAECQTKGRGRRGRKWLSPFGANVYFSIYWRLEGGIAQTMGLSLVVGVAIQEALKAAGIGDITLKWPNDVLSHDRKLAGILVELQEADDSECHVVIGVGVNFKMPNIFGREIDQPWTDIVSGGNPPISRNQLCANLLKALVGNLKLYETEGFPAFEKRWCALDRYYNEPVKLVISNRTIEGISKGVNNHGALLLQTHEGVRPFYGGEISLRPSS